MIKFALHVNYRPRIAEIHSSLRWFKKEAENLRTGNLISKSTTGYVSVEFIHDYMLQVV